MELQGPRRGWLIWTLRVLSLAMAIGGAIWGWKKFRPSEEQVELTTYVELQVPSYLERERAIHGRLDRLSSAPGPSPAEARKLLVEDVIPRLIALRKVGESVQPRTPTVRSVNGEYLAAVDKLIDACRSSVRAIDDPGLSAEAGHHLVRQRFLDAGSAAKAWSTHLRDACVKAKLAPPQ
ncbi:MAG: hypothetical protein EXR72_06275 [Myxococcales bacterium]|nr:hypothetical protein [Myxococcales bacterium]